MDNEQTQTGVLVEKGGKLYYNGEPRISAALYDALERMKYDNNGTPRGTESTPWIHLQSAVIMGSVSPLEAYDAIRLGYVPEFLLVRKSLYMDLV